MGFFLQLNNINFFIIKSVISLLYATNMIPAFQEKWCQWGTAVTILGEQNASNSDMAPSKLDISA